MKIGYARVSTDDQVMDLQRDALAKAGCERVFEDTVSGSTVVREGLDRARDVMRPGDVLVVWRLDRLGRSLRHLIDLMSELESKGVGFKSLTESYDTTTPGGKLIFHIFASLAEFERALIRERTMAGLAAGRARGRKGGRRPKLDERKQAVALAMYDARRHPVAEIARTVGCSERTLYAYVAARDRDRAGAGERENTP